MSQHELQIVDPIGWLRSRAEQFFPSGRVSDAYLLGILVDDAVTFGQTSCSVHRADDWWIVSSVVDWLISPGGTLLDTFQRIVPTPNRSLQYSFRGGVFLTAFASSIATSTCGERTTILGATPSEAVWELAGNARRAVLFTVEEPRGTG
jgi:hypothetical protein